MASVAFFLFSRSVSADFFGQLKWVFNLASNMGSEYGETPPEAGRVTGLAKMLTAHFSGSVAQMKPASLFLPLIPCLLYILEAWRYFRSSNDNWKVLFYLIPVICVGLVYALFFIHPRSLHYLLPAYLIAGVHLHLMFTDNVDEKRYQPAYLYLTVIIFCMSFTGLFEQTRLWRYQHYRDQVVEQRCNEVIAEYPGANLLIQAPVAQSVSVYKLILRGDRELTKVFEEKFGTVYRSCNVKDGYIEESVLPTLVEPTLLFVMYEIKSDKVQLIDHISMAWVYIYYYNSARRDLRSWESAN